jgi:hypothetical protein
MGLGGSRKFRGTPLLTSSVLAIAGDDLQQEALLLCSSLSSEAGGA